MKKVLLGMIIIYVVSMSVLLGDSLKELQKENESLNIRLGLCEKSVVEYSEDYDKITLDYTELQNKYFKCKTARDERYLMKIPLIDFGVTKSGAIGVIAGILIKWILL